MKVLEKIKKISNTLGFKPLTFLKKKYKNLAKYKRTAVSHFAKFILHVTSYYIHLLYNMLCSVILFISKCI